MKSANSAYLRRRLVRAAILSAIPLSFATGDVYASCQGSIAAPASPTSNPTISVLCNSNGASTDGNLTVSDSATFADLTGAGSTSYVSTSGNILVQFDGQGRQLTVNEGGVVDNFRNVRGERTAVNLGAPTESASDSTTFDIEPVAGATTVTTTATPSESWIGQSIIFGRWDSGEENFFPGQSSVITAVDPANNSVTLSAPLPEGFAGTGNADMPLVYSVMSNYGAGFSIDGVFYNNLVSNAGNIASRIQPSELRTNLTTVSTPYNSAIYGIRTTVLGNYLINNAASGVIQVSHAGIGAAQAIEAGGNVSRLDVNNSGLIEAIRSNPLTLTASTKSGVSVTTPGLSFNAGALGIATAIFTEEETSTLNLNNSGTGIIRASGDYTGSVFLRAEETNIVNDGLIEHVSSAGGADYSKGFAIGAMSSEGEIRELVLTNNGTIHGDILAVNGNALRWYLLSTVGDSSAGALGSQAALDAGMDSRLTINSFNGQENTEITNNGTIIGNIWLSNGEHEFDNSGTISGNIQVDQRDTQFGTPSGTVITILPGSDDAIDPATGQPFPSNNTVQGTGEGAGFVIRGNKALDFGNDGTFNGNLEIINATSSYTGQFGDQTLSATVSSINNITNTGIFNGNILITDVAGAENNITLDGNGFNGSISASTGQGQNNLTLLGEGTLAGSVSNFTTLNIGQTADQQSQPAAEEDDDDEEESAAEEVVPPNWTLSAGQTYQFSEGAFLNEGALNVLGTLDANLLVGAGTVLTGSGVISGNLTADGTVDLGLNTLTIGNNAVFNSGSVLRIQLADGVNGKLAVAHNVDFQPGSLLELDHRDMFLRTGQNFSIITHNALPNLPQINTNGLVRWLPTDVNGNFSLTAQVNAANVFGLSQNGISALNALMQADSFLARQFQNLPNQATVRTAGEQLYPVANGSILQSTLDVGNIVMGVLYNRLSDTHFAQESGANYFGKKQDQGFGVWLQGFGLAANQSTSSTVNGWNSSLGGVGFGGDTLIGDAKNLRVGAAFNYGSSTVTQNGRTNANQTNIDSYLGTVYASMLFDQGFYINAALGGGQHQYSGKRVLLTSAIGSSYDAWQFIAHADAGMPFKTDYGTVTPVVGFTYSHLNQDGYRERGLGALNIGGADTDSFRTTLGARLQIPLIDIGKVNTALQLHGLWNHEYLNTNQMLDANFVTGGPTFAVNTASPARDSGDIGIGFRVSGSYREFRPSLLATYNAGVRDQYLGNTAYLRANVEF